jgi:peroxiredoxin
MIRSFRMAALGILLAVQICSSTLGAEAEVRRYTGKLAAETEGEGDVEKSIELTVFLPAGEDNRSLFWVQTESAGKGRVWLERFGQLEWDAGGAAQGPLPQIRFDWGGGESLVPVMLLTPRPASELALESRWERDELQYEVVGQQRAGEQDVWQISVRNRFGEQRVVLCEKSRPLAVAFRETVFLGQGQKHQLQLELAERRSMTDAAWQQMLAEHRKLEDLRNRLGGTTDAIERRWNDEQLALMKDELATLAPAVNSPGYSQLVKLAVAETRVERGRAGALETLRARALTQALPDFQLEKVTRDGLSRADLTDKVTVIHFWEYRDAPLREPYGQAGYLDFLHRRYEAKGVRVLGVVVNQFSEVPQERRTAVTGARKFASFMNLSYPVYVDGGALLKAIGDPRTCDTPLPLFVVIGRDGRVMHYNAGFYQVNANEGLVELETAIKQALESGE